MSKQSPQVPDAPHSRTTRDLIRILTTPQRTIAKIDAGVGQMIDRLLAENAPAGGDAAFAPAVLRRVAAELQRQMEAAGNVAKAAVFVPVGLWGLAEGFGAPDLDIKLLGVGKHRFFLFHSALGLVALRRLFRLWQERSTDPEAFRHRFGAKVAGAALGTYAIGVGLHLAVDVFQPKSIVFPFFGSLVDGTLIDDRIWLIGNSLWAFQIARDVFGLVLADELASARRYVNERLAGMTAVPELQDA